MAGKAVETMVWSRAASINKEPIAANKTFGILADASIVRSFTR